MILAVVVVGRYLLDGMFRLVARTRVKEAMTASALLTVVGVTLVMQLAGLPASLGAFIAGVLLADSDYRHEIVADIAPFEGLLLGLFFTAIGMSLNLGLIAQTPYLVAAIVAGLLAIKSAHPVRPRTAGGPGSPGLRAASRWCCRRAASSPSCCSRPGPRQASSIGTSPTCSRWPSRCPWRQRRCCC